jgi:hypothetical protein
MGHLRSTGGSRGVECVFWNACKLLAKGASDAEKADLFSGTGSTALIYPTDLLSRFSGTTTPL